MLELRQSAAKYARPAWVEVDTEYIALYDDFEPSWESVQK